MKRKTAEIIKPYIRASSIGNHIMNDGQVDYINKQEPTIHSLATKYIMEQGVKFENELMNLIKEAYDVFQPEFTCDEKEHKYNKTIDAINEKHNIIYQGYLYDKEMNVGGSPDLMVKTTYLNTLMGSNIINDDEDYYVIIDIKHSNIHLDGIYIKNVNRIPAYKAQIYIYTKILNNIQQINKNKAYIWGKEYSNGANFLNTLGVIDYDGVDKEFIKKTFNAIDWITKVHNEEMFLNPPSYEELYPNMKSNVCINIKKTINQNINDITTMWNCSVKHRKRAHSSDITSWKNASSDLLGLHNNKGDIVDNIISINNQMADTIRITKPLKLSKRDDTIIIFIDFEGFSDKMKCKIKDGFILDNNNYYIYMIGIGYIIDGIWTYKSFIMKNTHSQGNILTSLFYYLRTLLRKMKKTKIEFYHWSHYEKSHFNRIKDTAHLCLSPDTYSFIDLCNIFQNHVVIKDSFNFKLKNIANALYSNKMITTCYNTESDCLDGLDACINALKIYDENIPIANNPIIKTIEEYNSIDCKMLYELYTLLEKLAI